MKIITCNGCGTEITNKPFGSLSIYKPGDTYRQEHLCDECVDKITQNLEKFMETLKK